MGEARSFSWAPNEIIKSYFLHPSPTDSRNTGVICHAAAVWVPQYKTESKRMRSRYEKWRVRPNRLAVKGWGGEDSHSSGLGTAIVHISLRGILPVR